MNRQRCTTALARAGGARPLVAVLLAATLLSACGGGTTAGSGASASTAGSAMPTTSAPTTPFPTPTPSTTAPTPATPAPDRADAVLGGLDLRARAGQLVMTGLRLGNGEGPTVAALRDHGVGNVFLGGRSTAGAAAVAGVVARLQAAAPSGVPLLVATDQEGGQVQVLRGPGFEPMPSGVQQGRTDPAALTAAAQRWGGQLAAAGVRMDLGPVLDTVAPGADNPPIGGYDRQFGDDPATVSAHGNAVAAGLLAAGVAPTAKHFPGLGRVTADTDRTVGVTDATTAVDDADLQPFRDAVAAGVPAVMISSAVYSRIDATQQALFSPAVVTDLLRGRLGFGGVVVTDDVGSARAVAAVPVGDRATRFVAAGGDLVLDVDPSHAAALVDALVARAQADPTFAASLDAAVHRVLELKSRLGLLG